MPYTTGSQGVQTNCASVFMTTLDTALLAVTGVTNVDQVVNGNVTARVYKFAAANNFFGSDWYLIVKRASDTATAISFGVTEQYNSTTHLCFNYAPSASSLVPTAQYAVNDPSGKAPDNSALGVMNLSITASAFNYWLSITGDRVHVAARPGSDSAIYAGLYDDFHPITSSPFPLVVDNMGVGAQVHGYGTREPYTTASNASNFQTYGTSSGAHNWNQVGTEVYSNKPFFSRAIVFGRATNYWRGLFRDVWLSGMTGANGDTASVTVNGSPRTLVHARGPASSLAQYMDTTV